MHVDVGGKLEKLLENLSRCPSSSADTRRVVMTVLVLLPVASTIDVQPVLPVLVPVLRNEGCLSICAVSSQFFRQIEAILLHT